MKPIIMLCLLLVVGTTVGAQDAKSTKMEAFSAQRGVVKSVEDYQLSNLSLSMGSLPAMLRIRKITIGRDAKLFLLISRQLTNNEVISRGIAYEDFLAIEEVFTKLYQQSLNDATTKSDYMESGFITEDGLELGYYVSKGKVAWYIKLDSTADSDDGRILLIKDHVTIQKALGEAKRKMKELQ